MTILLNTAYTKVLIESAHEGAQEAMSIPFQQTARCLQEYPDDVSLEEKNVISRVMDLKEIEKKYDSLLSDPVKATYHGDTKSLVLYLGVWAKMFFRHLDVYVSATFHNCMGFLYPNVKVRGEVNSSMYNTVGDCDDLVFHIPHSLVKIRSVLKGYALVLENFPLFFLFSNVAVYGWIVIYSFIRSMIKRRKKELFLLLPSSVSLLICIAASTFYANGVRYALPVIFATWFLVGIIYMRDRMKK